LDRHFLSAHQEDRIACHATETNGDNAWDVDTTEKYILLNTYMDNFDMGHFLRETLRVPKRAFVEEAEYTAWKYHRNEDPDEE
jgi:hypothetical protein